METNHLVAKSILLVSEVRAWVVVEFAELDQLGRHPPAQPVVLFSSRVQRTIFQANILTKGGGSLLPELGSPRILRIQAVFRADIQLFSAVHESFDSFRLVHWLGDCLPRFCGELTIRQRRCSTQSRFRLIPLKS